MTGASPQQPDAGDRLECEREVLGRLADLDAELLGDRAGDLRCAPDVAGRAVADPHHAVAAWAQVELRVERRDAVDRGERDPRASAIARSAVLGR